MASKEILEESPKIVVMNINPENIDNCIRHTFHGAKMNTAAAGNTKKLNRGDICLIRRTSGGGRYQYGVVGIWYYYDKEDIEGLKNLNFLFLNENPLDSKSWCYFKKRFKYP